MGRTRCAVCALCVLAPPLSLAVHLSPRARCPPRTRCAACNITTWTTPPRTSFERPRATASNSRSRVLGVRRAKQRWSALVSAPTSRLAKCMRARLGDALWAEFVSHANAHYKQGGLPLPSPLTYTPGCVWWHVRVLTCTVELYGVTRTRAVLGQASRPHDPRPGPWP